MTSPTFDNLSAEYFDNLIAQRIKQETEYGGFNYNFSMTENPEYRRKYCIQEFSGALSKYFLREVPQEKVVVKFLENFEKNFPKSSKYKNTQLNECGFVPDFLSLQTRSAWEAFHVYDMCVFYNFKDATKIMEEKYHAQFCSSSVATLMTLLTKCAIKVVSPDQQVSLETNSILNSGTVLRFYERLKNNIDLNISQNHNNFRLIDFLAKARAYGELENVENEYMTYQPKIAQEATFLYDTLLQDQLEKGAQILNLPNPDNYNYSPLDYALYAENFYFLEKVIHAVSISDKQKKVISNIFAKSNLAQYDLRNESVKDKITTLIEKTRLEEMLSSLSNNSASTLNSTAIALKKKTNKI